MLQTAQKKAEDEKSSWVKNTGKVGEERDGRRANMTAVIREQPRIGGEGK